jgi:hypothetical protein
MLISFDLLNYSNLALNSCMGIVVIILIVYMKSINHNINREGSITAILLGLYNNLDGKVQ